MRRDVRDSEMNERSTTPLLSQEKTTTETPRCSHGQLGGSIAIRFVSFLSQRPRSATPARGTEQLNSPLVKTFTPLWWVFFKQRLQSILKHYNPFDQLMASKNTVTTRNLVFGRFSGGTPLISKFSKGNPHNMIPYLKGVKF